MWTGQDSHRLREATRLFKVASVRGLIWQRVVERSYEGKNAIQRHLGSGVVTEVRSTGFIDIFADSGERSE